MPVRFTPSIAFTLGLVFLTLGAALRFESARLGAAALGNGPAEMMQSLMDPAKGQYARMMSLAQQGAAMSDVALTLLWTGGALVALAAAARLFSPAWRLAPPAGPAPGAIGADHPVLGDIP